MEFQNLETASTYLNNLLLARGLLRNGKSVDFAHPANCSGGSEATMARIINLVHDLILRRDREGEQREDLVATIRSLRAGESRHKVELDRLSEKVGELTRSASLVESQERALKTSLRTAEAGTRSLKEQMLRMKQTLQQARSQCANEVRKRDLELQRLKAHVSGVQRGRREAGLTTITITPLPTTTVSHKGILEVEPLGGSGVSLDMETNEFLTNLCQKLGDENDALVGLTRSTISTLKDLQGLECSPIKKDIGSSGNEEECTSILRGEPNKSTESNNETASFTELDEDMQNVLENLRNILTNPSFAPIEEVELREEELVRLRASWEKMEIRWQEALGMMDGWRKHMMDGGDSETLEEIKKGLGLGLSLTQRLSGEESSQLTSHSSVFDEHVDDEMGYDSLDDGDCASVSGENESLDDGPRSGTLAQGLAAAAQPVLIATSESICPLMFPRKVSFQEPDAKCTDPPLDGTSKADPIVKQEEKVGRPGEQKQHPFKSPLPRIPKLGVDEKLAAAEEEARAADQRRRKREREREQKASGAAIPQRKQASKSRSKRRRSTLSQEELLDLLGTN